MKNPLFFLATIWFAFLSNDSILAQNDGDYRTKANGNWNTLAIWERWDASSSQWLVATQLPPSSTTIVSVLHTVTLNIHATTRNVVVSGNLNIKAKTLTVEDGFVNINAGGTLQLTLNGRVHGTGSGISALNCFAGSIFKWTDGNLSGDLTCEIMDSNFQPTAVAFTWGSTPDTLSGAVVFNLRTNVATPPNKKVFLKDAETQFNVFGGATMTLKATEFFGPGTLLFDSSIKTSHSGASKINCEFTSLGGTLDVSLGPLELGHYFGYGPITVRAAGILRGVNLVNNPGPFNNLGTIENRLVFNGGFDYNSILGNGNGKIKSIVLDNQSYLGIAGKQLVLDSLLLHVGVIYNGGGVLSLSDTCGLVASENGVCQAKMRRFVPNDGVERLFPCGFNTGSGAPYAYFPTTLTVPVSAPAGEFFTVWTHPNIFKKYTAALAPNSCFTGSGPMVNMTWFVKEDLTGGTTADLKIQWDSAYEAPGFLRDSAFKAQYLASNWTLGGPLPISGTGPYSATFSGLTTFSVFGAMNALPTWNCGTKPEAEVAQRAENAASETFGQGNGGGFSVFPNPVSDVLNFDLPDGFAQDLSSFQKVTNLTASIHDAAGRLVFSKEISNNPLNVSDLKAGIYFLKIEGDGKSAAARFVKN